MPREYARPWASTDTPPGLSRVPELIRVPADEEISGIITSDQIWELQTHWHQGRTRPCTIASGQCELCGIAPERWFGLIQVYLRAKQRHVWVQLTADAVMSLQLKLREDKPMLGAEVNIGRVRKTTRAPIWINISWASTDPRRLPKPGTPHETLSRVFGESKPARQRKAS